MRIGINGRFLIAKQTGVQRAAYNLLKAVVEHDSRNEYLIFTGPSQMDNPQWSYPNVTIVPSKLKIGESIVNHLWEQFQLPRLAHKYKVDVLHSPANLAPVFYRGTSLVHIHDLCFIVKPDWYSFAFRTLYNFLIPHLARAATRIVTNSNNSRNDLLQFCQVGADKVNLVYWAVDEKFLKSSKADHLSPLPENDYILYVGSLEPRKNVSTLIKAYEKLRERNPQTSIKLVLIGGESPLFASAKLSIRKYQNDIILKGFVSEDTLLSYYKHACFLAYPSLYEGFGLPPLEAMASGLPVITSNTSSLPEVVGNAALLVDPMDVGGLVKAMEDILGNSQLRERLISLGAERVKRFSWSKIASIIIGIYDELKSEQSSQRYQAPRSFW